MKNERLVTITDMIAKNEEISKADFASLRSYFYACNRPVYVNMDDVMSSYVLAVRENYDVTRTMEEKLWRIKKTISGHIFMQAENETQGTLYYPVPSGDYDVVNTPDNSYEDVESKLNSEFIDKFLKENLSEREYEMYTQYIIGDKTLQEIGDSWGITREGARKVKNTTMEKVKFLVENYLN